MRLFMFAQSIIFYCFRLEFNTLGVRGHDPGHGCVLHGAHGRDPYHPSIVVS